MDTVARALLLREALSTTRMSKDEGVYVEMERNYAVPPGEYVTEWLEENSITMAELAFSLGVNETYTTELIEGKIPVSEEIAKALEELTGIPVKQWAVLDATYWKDRARIAKVDVHGAVSTRRDALLGDLLSQDEALMHRLADER